jgi:hypothetical protein
MQTEQENILFLPRFEPGSLGRMMWALDNSALALCVMLVLFNKKCFCFKFNVFVLNNNFLVQNSIFANFLKD